MFAKVFAQIFDSSIAENYQVRHVFEDLLKLADKDGVVDMTLEAIARRTNVPFEKVKFGIEELMKPDASSRSKECEGRRLMPLDSHRDWGWQIVNYQHYRSIVDEEARRSYFRDAKKKQRTKGKPIITKVTPVGKSFVEHSAKQYEKALKDGAKPEELDDIVTKSLPKELREEAPEYKVESPKSCPDLKTVVPTSYADLEKLPATPEQVNQVAVAQAVVETIQSQIANPHIHEDDGHFEGGVWVKD